MTTSHLDNGGLTGPTYPTPAVEADFIGHRCFSSLQTMNDERMPPHMSAAARGASFGKMEVSLLQERMLNLECEDGFTVDHVPMGLPKIPKQYLPYQSAFMNAFGGEWAAFGRHILTHTFNRLPRQLVPINGLYPLLETHLGKFLPPDLAMRVLTGIEVHPYPDQECGNRWESLAHTFKRMLTCSPLDLRDPDVAEMHAVATKWEQEREELVSEYLRGIYLWEGVREYCIERGLLKKGQP